MIDKATKNKIQNCKALQGKTVNDIIGTDRFRQNLAAYLKAQIEDRNATRKSYTAMLKAGGAIGMKLPAHPVDHFVGMTVDAFAFEYAKVVNGCSDRTTADRRYIEQLGQQAYNLTIAQIVVEEFPELTPVLLPKPEKAN